LTSPTGSCLEFSGGFADRIVGGNNNIRLIAPTAFPQSTGVPIIAQADVEHSITPAFARHGAPKVQPPQDGVPGQVRTSIGIVAKEAPWSVQAGILQLKEAIQNTWNVRCQIVQLTEEQAASLRRQWPMQPKQWVADGQYPSFSLGPDASTNSSASSGSKGTLLKDRLLWQV
jgi:hypothetical protein